MKPNLKPEPEITENYIRIRVKNPNLFQPDSFRTIDISKSEGIKAVIGKLKGETTTTIQSYLFDKEKWTLSEAQEWVREHAKKHIGINPEWLEEKTMEKQIKYFRPTIKTVDEKNHIIDAVITTNQKDRDNEVIQTDAWKENIKSYLEHPVLLSSHNYMDLRKQIGQALSINFNDNNVEMKFKYYVGDGNPEADWGWVLASKGMAMFSVGFKPIEWLDGEEVRALHIDDENPPIREFTKAELLEVSQVLVGSNRGALQLGINNPNVDQCQYMYDVVKSFGNKIPELLESELKSVIPFHAYPLADEGTDWDAGAEVRAAEVDDLKKMCAWFDSENSDIKNSYKLPHHKKEGYKTVWRGVSASMGALLGARGGVNIPDADRKGVYNHLAKHYKEFGKEAPEFKEYEKEIKSDITILPLKLDFKNIKEAEQIINIMKSGRVLSEKNRSLIKNCNDILEQAIKSLKELLEATQPIIDEEQEAEKSKKMLELQKSINEMLEKVKGNK